MRCVLLLCAFMLTVHHTTHITHTCTQIAYILIYNEELRNDIDNVLSMFGGGVVVAFVFVVLCCVYFTPVLWRTIINPYLSSYNMYVWYNKFSNYVCVCFYVFCISFSFVLPFFFLLFTHHNCKYICIKYA